MIFVVRKINIQRKQNSHKKVEIRNLKYFNAESFQADLRGQEWELLDNNLCVDKMWDTWKTLFVKVLDLHAPIREKRVKSKPNVPWLTSTIKNKSANAIALNLLLLDINRKITGTHTKPLEIA
jgi:hypothetical protein